MRCWDETKIILENEQKRFVSKLLKELTFKFITWHS